MKKYILFILLILAIAGIADSVYLTNVHFGKVIPPCPAHGLFIDCGKVLNSSYSVIWGIPLALFGVFHYAFLSLLILIAIITDKKLWRIFIVFQSAIGAFVSLYLMYLQLIVIGSICLYCTLSALTSFTLFVLTQWQLRKERKELSAYISAFKYQKIIKPILFQINPEIIHEQMTSFGELLGKLTAVKKIVQYLFKTESPILGQKIAGISFQNPVGLAAGFDYAAKLTQILPSLNFGFGSIGTITNSTYQGNPPPRLGRLPKSRSLMVNKGFKNLGAKKIIEKLEKLNFEYPVGISIGRTNPGIKTASDKTPLRWQADPPAGGEAMTPEMVKGSEPPSLKNSIVDIFQAFRLFEKSNLHHSYYELNISCPNLFGNISFYPPKNLEQLLTAVNKLRIKRPVFVKMPIEKSDKEVMKMLGVIIKFEFIKGVIIGNLQKNRSEPTLDPAEVKKFPVGNFSGKPCEKRSNELIKLAYRKYGKKLIIIGCGGIFSARDAYKKIKLGASLVQLITGMIYQGPQLISQINMELTELLQKDGFKNIAQAIGNGSTS